jgi:hypothetical protein
MTRSHDENIARVFICGAVASAAYTGGAWLAELAKKRREVQPQTEKTCPNPALRTWLNGPGSLLTYLMLRSASPRSSSVVHEVVLGRGASRLGPSAANH